MATTFDILTAARDPEAAGIDCKRAEAVATVIRAGQGGFAGKSEIAGLCWMVAVNMAITLASLAAALKVLP